MERKQICSCVVNKVQDEFTVFSCGVFGVLSTLVSVGLLVT